MHGPQGVAAAVRTTPAGSVAKIMNGAQPTPSTTTARGLAPSLVTSNVTLCFDGSSAPAVPEPPPELLPALGAPPLSLPASSPAPPFEPPALEPPAVEPPLVEPPLEDPALLPPTVVLPAVPPDGSLFSADELDFPQAASSSKSR
jgi:hypothetical protein